MSSQAFSWLFLAASVIAEVLGTVALRYSDGFTRTAPSIIVTLCYASAIWLMSVSVRHLEVGLAYAVWAGFGTVLIALLGILCFGESTAPLRLIGIALIVGGVVALNLSPS
ncbi:multidrug efflux SMR transporter [Aquitalea sp. ASV15]|uniref:DMT family transporter n=1 Tax=Aquitalea sp. ASV15 TaxID=2795104 RepID=UPI0018ED9A2C|nr:multidrug efflux SMR transporter [Aquitalea sp. ASV15]